MVYDLINVIQGEANLNQALIKDKQCDNLFVLAASQTCVKDALRQDGVRQVLNDLAAMGFEYIVGPAKPPQPACMLAFWRESALYLRFIEEHPTSPMVEQAEKARTAFAQKRLKSRSVGGFRPDVMMYIAGALQIFKKGGAQQRQKIALEIAMLGRTGLDINDSADRYTLKALPGKFSGLHLLAIMYTAFRQIDPTMDTGADFSAEYQAAIQMQND